MRHEHIRIIVQREWNPFQIKAGLPIVNAYAKSVGEEPLEGTIRDIITGKRSERKSPLSPEELRKFARMHKQAEIP
jgi:hypothetical protein